MTKLAILKGLQVLMLLFAIFELYVAYVSPTIQDRHTFIALSLVSTMTLMMLKKRVSKLKLRSLRIED